jgi:preprotein translocase subunit SecE
MVLSLGGAVVLSEKLGAYAPPIVQYGVPSLLVVALGVLLFWMVNRPSSADFLIATEGEMKKVSWSSRKEIVGSTKVVIVATFMLAVILAAVDAGFAVLSKLIGLMGA